ncbi:hypothetical protein [Psychrobacter sp. I-STPA6b]|uniref:hypothetical protein n=1 Tax=Psychrobacter sp. I-STPA6b TaxID=2585718 RepID=UPI001D0C7751|nr:hypothetical protein [Psychrobacter sp. I-STPA6b]
MDIDDLPRLILCPLRDSYNPTLGNDVITTQYENGMPRQRLAGIGRPHRTPVAFRHKAIHQDYLLAFWRLYRAKPFAMRLILDSTDLQWYECRFVGDAQIKDLGNKVFEFAIEIVAKPKPLNLKVDEAVIWAYGQTDGDLSSFFNPLEKLVNEDLPNAVRELHA